MSMNKTTCLTATMYFQCLLEALPHGGAPHGIRNLRRLQLRLSKMHAKAPICFNVFNFHPVSTKFSINIEHIILTNRMFFVFGIASCYFLAGKLRHIGDFINPYRRADYGYFKTEI
jgi:hypothetical protein